MNEQSYPSPNELLPCMHPVHCCIVLMGVHVCTIEHVIISLLCMKPRLIVGYEVLW